MTLTRVMCTNPRLPTHWLYGTVVGHEQPSVRPLPIRHGVIYDVVWLDLPNNWQDEIDGGNLRAVSEVTYQIEAVERRIDRG